MGALMSTTPLLSNFLTCREPGGPEVEHLCCRMLTPQAPVPVSVIDCNIWFSLSQVQIRNQADSNSYEYIQEVVDLLVKVMMLGEPDQADVHHHFYKR